jgi:hypothetical protein
MECNKSTLVDIIWLLIEPSLIGGGHVLSITLANKHLAAKHIFTIKCLKTFSDIVQSNWQTKDDGSGDKVREVSFTLSLTNSMGYKHSQVTETQVCIQAWYLLSRK